MSILNTRFRRWAQVMAAWRSAGVRTSALEIDLMPFPRQAGVRYMQPGDQLTLNLCSRDGTQDFGTQINTIRDAT